MTKSEYTRSVPTWANDAIRFAMRICGSKADSEDAVQEALLTLWQHCGEVDVSRGKGYLMSATYRQLMMTFRRIQTERAHAPALMTEDRQQANLQFDLQDAINRALTTLTPQQRAVLQLRDIEGYTYREVAEILKISEDTVQVTLFRARVNMRKQLKAEGYDSN